MNKKQLEYSIKYSKGQLELYKTVIAEEEGKVNPRMKLIESCMAKYQIAWERILFSERELEMLNAIK